MNIFIITNGNFGNRAMQYLAAAGIKSFAPTSTIQNILLPECGINEPSLAPPQQNTVTTGRGWIDIAGYADCLTRGVVETVLIDDYPFHLENFPARETARRLIPPLPGGQDATGFGPTDLVCSIRAAEILRAAHPDYLPLPPAYYQSLATRTGLSLVFFGQIGDDPYADSLRRTFPTAAFIPGRDPAYDFETLRRSANIAPSVSTFAWLAAWLSHAQKIYLPVCGFLSPVQHPDMLFLPLDDPSFEYTLFPYVRAADLFAHPARFFLTQDILAQNMREITAEELRAIAARVRQHHPRRPLLSGFDPSFYLQACPDVREALAAGCPSALHHYVTAGFAEGRDPLPLDREFYPIAYPDAAQAIAEGHFASPLHHYQAIGYAKGHTPLP